MEHVTGMKGEVIVTIKATGEVLARMSSSDFMKTVDAPKSMFVRTAVDQYNEAYPDNHAEHKLFIMKRGKWKAL